jgi:hypothetical protein
VNDPGLNDLMWLYQSIPNLNVALNHLINSVISSNKMKLLFTSDTGEILVIALLQTMCHSMLLKSLSLQALAI